MAQQTDENGKPLTYWGGLDFTNKNANNINSDSTQVSGTILASESLGVDNLVNKQQTAVEWLIMQLKEYDFADIKDSENYIIKIPAWVLTEKEEQAKQMEKEQITDSYIMGSYDMAEKEFRPEQYYNETYAENKTFKQNKFDPNFMHEWIRNNGMRPTKEKE